MYLNVGWEHEKLQPQKHNNMNENRRKIRYNNIADFAPSFHFYI